MEIKRSAVEDLSIKKRKLNEVVGTKLGDQTQEKNGSGEQESTVLQNFDGFKIKNILNNSADYKRVIVEAVVSDGQSAILDNKPLTEQVLESFFSEMEISIEALCSLVVASFLVGILTGIGQNLPRKSRFVRFMKKNHLI